MKFEVKVRDTSRGQGHGRGQGGGTVTYLATSRRACPGPPAVAPPAGSATTMRSIAASRVRPKVPANAAGTALLQARAAAASHARNSARAA